MSKMSYIRLECKIDLIPTILEPLFLHVLRLRKIKVFKFDESYGANFFSSSLFDLVFLNKSFTSFVHFVKPFLHDKFVFFKNILNFI